MAKLLRVTAAVSCAVLAQGQDLGMSAMALGVAGQMAKMGVSKMEEKMKDSKAPMPCIGDHCCTESSCMNIPGMSCSRERGPTKCVGASTFPPVEGMCGCLAGACSVDGKCSSDGLPQTFASSPSPTFPSSAGLLAPTPALAAPAPAPAQAAYADSGDTGNAFGQWHGQGTVAAALDDFSKWHTSPQRLFESRSVATGKVPREDFTVALTLMGAAGLGLFVGLSALAVRLGRHIREPLITPETQSLVESADSDRAEA
mmetsp:Transcript_87487/g.250683  ORF Transcript_87487/g.250683 Transcript_87487/m.250683 type:complete len:257 (-) Transcript_87487:134-904(-)